MKVFDSHSEICIKIIEKIIKHFINIKEIQGKVIFYEKQKFIRKLRINYKIIIFQQNQTNLSDFRLILAVFNDESAANAEHYSAKN